MVKENRPRKRTTRLPADFTPKQQHIDLAAEVGVDLRFEFAKFRDYWIGEGKTKADWDATLRNWIRTAAERRTGPRPVRLTPSGAPVIPISRDDVR